MYQLLTNGLPFKELLTCALSNITTFFFREELVSLDNRERKDLKDQR